MSILHLLLFILFACLFLWMLRRISGGKGRGLPGPIGHMFPINGAFWEMITQPKEYRTLHRYVSPSNLFFFFVLSCSYCFAVLFYSCVCLRSPFFCSDFFYFPLPVLSFPLPLLFLVL